MAAEIEVPKRMFIHGFLLMEGHKMSKSLGNALDVDEVIEKFGADALRFYCFREVSFGQDGQISPAGFESRYESELADQYGNLANRVLSMIGRYRDGAVPDAEAETVLADELRGRARARPRLLDDAELTQALEEIWKLVRRLNEYVEETRPWELAKDDVGGRPARLRPLRPRRGAAGDDPAAPRLHAGDDRSAARRAGRARTRARRVRLAGRRPVAGRAGAPVPEARSGLIGRLFARPRIGLWSPKTPWYCAPLPGGLRREDVS